MRRSSKIGAVFLSLVLLGLSGQVGAAEPTLSVARTVPPGTPLAVTSSGFTAGESVTFSLDGEASNIGVATADASGAVNASPTVPPTTRPGEHLLIVSGATSGKEISSAFKVSTPWGQYGYRQTNTHYNPHENVINPGNVSQLQRVWRTRNTGGGEVVVGSGRLFSRDGDAFSLASGRYLWSGSVYEPAAVYGKLFGVTTAGKLSALPQNCVPDASHACAPLWSSPPGEVFAKSSVDADRIYIARDGLEVYNVNCAGAACTPLWRSARGFGKPLVSNGLVYVPERGSQVGDHGTIFVYPIDCRSDGGLCEPLWELPLPGRIFEELALAEGRLFVSTEVGGLVVYRENCGGRPEGCKVLWRTDHGSTEPSVANGIVYSGGSAYLTDCRRDGGLCAPLWRYSGIGGPLTVAGGLVWGAASIGPGFIAAAPAICGVGFGVGSACDPLWFSPATASPGFLDGGVVVSDGVVFASSGDHKVYAYALPESAGGVAPANR